MGSKMYGVELMHLLSEDAMTEQLHRSNGGVSNYDKLKWMERELDIRRRVYSSTVRIGQMNPQTASIELKIMEAIVSDYQKAGGSN
jgi:uncharacterized protein (UPF0303 family)